MKICRVEGCAGKHYSSGYCNAHYRRFRRYGNPLEGRASEGEPARFVRDVALAYSDKAKCLLWPYARDAGGYGVIVVDGRNVGSHRYVCLAANGLPPSPAHEAAHSCGNRICCNPLHLRWATVRENHADKDAHGTAQRGEGNGRAKLTEKDVKRIRELADQLTGAALAREYNVTKEMIYQIIHRKAWVHV